MEQNDQLMKDSILNLYKLLTNSYVENSDLITNQLMEIYSQQEINIIPILFDIFLNNSNITFRKQASIGIRICIKKSFKNLNEDSIQQIWNAFFQIFSSEQDEELLQCIIVPAIELFSQSRKTYDTGFENFGFFNFFQYLKELNFIRCLQILTVFLPENIKFEKKNYDFACYMLQLSYQYPEKYKIVKEIVFLSYLLISQKQIEDDVKNEISLHLSQLFVEFLSDMDDLKFRLILHFIPILNSDIQPLKMDIIFGPILQFLLDQNISIKLKYNIAFIFSLIFTLDDSKFDTNDIVSLFKLSIYISVMVFDDSDNPSDPDSVSMCDLITDCLRRLPNEKAQNIVATTFQCLIKPSNNTEEFDFGTSSLYSKLYTALSLIDSALQVSVYLFIDFVPKISEFCVTCFEANHPAVQNYASYIFKENISIFKDHLLPTIQDIAATVISKLENNEFLAGFEILSEILDNFPIEICNQLFLPIYNLCSKKVEIGEGSSFSNVSFNSWFLLATLFRNVSEETGSSYFDEIFPPSIGLVNSFYEAQKQEQNFPSTDILSIVVELIGSFSESCSSKLEPHFNDVISLLLELLQIQFQGYLNHLTNDLMLFCSILNCLGLFITNMAKLASPYIDTFLPTIIENLKQPEKNDQDFETLEMIRQRKENYSKMFVVPSISLLEIIIENTPEKIKSLEIISDICFIAIHAIDSITKNEVLEGIDLITQIINLYFKFSQKSAGQNDATYLDLAKMFVPIIYKQLSFEIQYSVPYGEYDAFNAWIGCIGNLYMKFKINAFEIDEDQQKRYLIFDIFDNLIDIAGSTYQNVEDDSNGGVKLRFIRDLHDNIEKVLTIIIKYYQQEDFSVFGHFIPKILRFFEAENIYFHVFAINIFSYYICKSSIIEADLILQLFDRSVKSIVDDDPHFSRYFVFFLSNLRFNYNQLLIENNDKLIQIIDTAISALDVSKSECRCLVEYLLTLFASIDLCVGVESGLTNSQRFNWFISKLPIQFSQEDNNQLIFRYLIAHFDQFPELKSNVFALFCQIFVSTSSISRSFLNKETVQLIFQIIVRSNILENQEAVMVIFNGDEGIAKSFYETIQKLCNLSESN